MSFNVSPDHNAATSSMIVSSHSHLWFDPSLHHHGPFEAGGLPCSTPSFLLARCIVFLTASSVPGTTVLPKTSFGAPREFGMAWSCRPCGCNALPKKFGYKPRNLTGDDVCPDRWFCTLGCRLGTHHLFSALIVAISKSVMQFGVVKT